MIMEIGFIEFENGRDNQPVADPFAAAWDKAWPDIMALLEANYRLDRIQSEFDVMLHEATGSVFMYGGDLLNTSKVKLYAADWKQRCDEFMRPIRERREAAINDVNKHYRSVDVIMQPALKKFAMQEMVITDGPQRKFSG